MMTRMQFVLFFCSYWILCSTAGDRRPIWDSDVKNVMDMVAKDNGWNLDSKQKYHKAHALPWQAISTKINSGLSNSEMRSLINDLSTPHKDAAFYQNMNEETRKKYLEINQKKKNTAMNALARGDKRTLAKALFNMPGNVFPGDPSKNMAIKNRFDPPRKGKFENGRYVRTNENSDHSKDMMKKYKISPYSRNNYNVRSDRDGCSKRKRRSLGGCGITKKKDKKSKTKRIFKGLKKIGSKSWKGMRKFGRKGKMNLKMGMIDLTGGWIPKHKEDSATGGVIQPKAGSSVNSDSVTAHASAGSIHGHAESGFSKAGGRLEAGVKTYAGKEGINAEVKLPSGYASTHGFGVGGDLSSKAEITIKKDHARIGVSGPGASVNLGPFSGGIGVGLGVEASSDVKKGIGAKADTPVGSFGAKVGCITEICIFGCVAVKVC